MSLKRDAEIKLQRMIVHFYKYLNSIRAHCRKRKLSLQAIIGNRVFGLCEFILFPFSEKDLSPRLI